LGEGLRDNFAAAQDTFTTLLARPDLDDVIRAPTLNSGALFAQVQGEYERALAWYAQSNIVWEQLGNIERQGLALLNAGIVHYELQHYDEAEGHFQRSAGMFQAVGAIYRQGQAFNELGLLYRDQGRWDAALAQLGLAVECFAIEEATDFLGRVENNIGEIELLCGQFDAARQRFERALLHMTTRVYEVDVRINLGLIAQAMGDDIAALAHYGEALDLAREIERRDAYPLIHARLGHAARRLGRPAEAKAHYAAAVAAVEATRMPLRNEGVLISLMGRWQQVYEALVELCLDLGDAAGAFDYAERARARAFADMLARREGLNHAATPPATARAVLDGLAPGALLVVYFAIGLRGPEAALLDAMPLAAAHLRDCLAIAPRLLRFSLGAGVLRAADCSLDPNLLQAAGVYQTDGQRFLRSPVVLRRLYDALIAPDADLIARAEQLVIVPHGPLHQLPFAALLDADHRALLDQAPRLSYTPSATLLLRTGHPQSTTAPPDLEDPGGSSELAFGRKSMCLALGYDGGSASRLRHTEAEALAVAQLCGGSALRGAHGIRAQLLANAPACRWLHLACHGEFNLDDPLDSWLEIGPGERLSAAEVLAELRLDADLVTLSACRSGLSRVLRGDEPFGLVRAFLSAGARTVLVTLWEVEDVSARLLMEQFYRILLEQGTVRDLAGALRSAQHHLRNLSAAEVRAQLATWGADDSLVGGAERPFADPSFWAAYMLVRRR
jgi:CHAT domain-containing protein/Tfp pilus assembly protein PilF